MPHPLSAKAALSTLFILQLLMLAALYTGTAPHPPAAIKLFAMAPYLSASLSLCVAAWIMIDTRPGMILATAAVLTALLSYGPHKYFDPAFPQIWPAVIAAQIAAIVILVQWLPVRQTAQYEAT